MVTFGMSVRAQRVITQKTGRLFPKKSFFIISAVHRQAKDLINQANEYMEKSSEV